MLNISKYHKLIVSCSAIATASIGSFVQSANATEHFSTKNSQSNLGTILIAGGNVSNGGGGNVSNGGGGNVSNGGGGNVSNGGGGNVSGNGNPEKPNRSNSGSVNNSNANIGITGGFSSGFSPSQIARAQGLSGRINIAQGKSDAALAALAAAEAAQTPASSRTSPVRYGREPGDLAACGCPNADTASAGTPSPELVAARVAEAAAAAELAAAKAEARQFLESVKVGTESVGSGANRTIW